MSTTDELLTNAEAYAAAFDQSDLPLPPARKVAVLVAAHCDRTRPPRRGRVLCSRIS